MVLLVVDTQKQITNKELYNFELFVANVKSFYISKNKLLNMIKSILIIKFIQQIILCQNAWFYMGGIKCVIFRAILQISICGYTKTDNKQRVV